MTLRLLLLIVFACWSVAASAARAQCNATQLCPATADPCVVSSGCTVPAGATFDLGHRAFVIRPGKVLTVNDGAAALTIRAGSILLEPGARIVTNGEAGTFGSGGTVVLESRSTVALQSQGNALAKIDVTGGFLGGNIQVTAAGDASLDGLLVANCTSLDGFGGQIDVIAQSGSVSIAGAGLQARGGGRGENGASGGTVTLFGGQDATVAAPIDVQGGDCACEIMVDARDGGITTTAAALLSLQASGQIGSGGTVTMSAGTTVTLGGDIVATARGSGGLTGAGFGGGLDVFAYGDVVVSGIANVSGGAPDGWGGSIELQGRDIVVSGTLLAPTEGTGSGGDVFAVATRNLTVDGLVSVRGDAVGGTIDLNADGVARIASTLDASAGELGGQVEVTGCTVDVTPAGLLDARGRGAAPWAQNRIASSSAATVRGRLLAGASNRLAYRGATPTFTAPPLPLPHVAPAAVLVPTPTLRCCVGCPVCGDRVIGVPDETCDDGNTVAGDGCSPQCTVESTTTTTTPPTTTTLPGNGTCGNGAVEAGEQCDDGNRTDGDCCTGTCTAEAATIACASDGDPCTLDRCNGAGRCVHPAGNAGAVCRPPAGPCDVAEACTGASAGCPPDSLATAGAACRDARGPCDAAEFCTGTSALCPSDSSRAGICRPAAGACDLPERCDGTSDACPADVTVADGSPCDAGACAIGGACLAGQCITAERVACPACETCDPATGACTAAPRPACLEPIRAGAAVLRVVRSPRGSHADRLQLRWLAAPDLALDAFGDPSSTDAVALCLYDDAAAPRLLFRGVVAPGGTCDGQACWRRNGRKGWTFSSRTANTDGMTAATLTPGTGGKGKIQMTGKGDRLSGRDGGLPALPLAGPVTAQVHAGHDACFQARFDPAVAGRNDASRFDGRGH